MVRRQLGTKLTPALPISLFAPGSPLHELLVGYKAAPSPRARHERQALLSRLVGEFLKLHLPCILGKATDDRPATLAVPVPSSSGPRPSWGGEHPLVGLLGAALATEPALCLAPVIVKGTATIGHLRANRQGFRLIGPVAGRRVLVFDDTYTSGACAQSAAAALAGAGAEVVAIVPIGRLVHPDHNRATGALWARQQRERFDARRCAGPCQLWREMDSSSPLGPGADPLTEQQPPEAAGRAHQADHTQQAQIGRMDEQHRTDDPRVEAA